MITIKSLAKKLGVSHSTVSRALNDHPSISEKTKIRIKAEAEVQGYVVNQAANIIKNGNLKTVGLLIPDIDNSFYARLTSALTDFFREDGVNVILSVTKDDEKLEETAIKQLLSLRPAAILLVPSPNITDVSIAMIKASNGIQLIRKAINDDGVSFIGIDDTKSMGAVVDELYAKGHTQIAYLGRKLNTSTGIERLQGFISGCERYGIPSNMTSTSLYSHTAVASELQSLFSKHRFSAIIFGSEVITQAALKYLIERQLLGSVEAVLFGGLSWGAQLSKTSRLTLPLDKIAQMCHKIVKDRCPPSSVRYVGHFDSTSSAENYTTSNSAT
ncbi:LacI family DNA-binding transcriptional regulator [Marinomonas sp. TI.3.20]|uniref:LacI family DNA-binding transcriptional regulator n=1 Tax=Marinomonas sp. TI.3.20 TaxID=3121296 RepID=UPI00311EF82C